MVLLMHRPPPPEPRPLSLTVRDLALTVPTVVAMLLVAGLLGLPFALTYQAGQDSAPQAGPEQRWTAGTGTMASLSMAVVRGALPPADPRQRRPPCLERIGEEAFNGVCWLRLDVRPPCPKDLEAYAWEHNGKCYAYALKPAGLPTSGEGRPLGVAEP